VATDLGLCAIGRALNTRFLCFTGADRLQLEPAPLPDALGAAV
jgi:FdhD protein